MKKRFLSFLLVVIMVLTLFPVSAMATEGDGEVASSEIGLLTLSISRGGAYFWDSTVIPLSPNFDGAVTSYEAAKLTYPSSSNYQRLYVNATATEGASVKATITSADNTTASADIPAGVDTQVGSYVLLSGTNTLTLTVSKEGSADKVYTITIPVAAKFKWKTDLSTGGLYNNAADVTLSVAMDESIAAIGLTPTYQWYVNSTNSSENGEAISGATGTEYVVTKPAEGLGEPRYYYVIAKCEGYDDLTSKVCEVSWAEGEAPTSITLKHKVGDILYDLPHQNWDTVWAWAQFGDSFQLAAVDQNGKETPVTWSGSGYNYSIDENGILSITALNQGTIYAYPKATSRFAGGLSKENCVIVNTYDFGSAEYSTTLSTNGQSESSVSVSGGVAGHNTWRISEGYEKYASLVTELKGDGTDPVQLRFTALRPGSFTVTYTLGGFSENEISGTVGESFAENNGKTGTATVVIKGLAVEDSQGGRTKTYLEMKEGSDAPTMQLTAYTEKEEETITWTSADESVVTVDENGLITAVGVGSAMITAKDSNNKTGGIKVVVTSADKPYFENLAFQTGNAGIRSNTFSFSSTKLDYTGVALTSYSVNNLPITKDTLYNTDKYTATATYTDWHGNAMVVPVSSGEATTLEDMFFDTGVLTITLADKKNAENKTVYTFEMTRPRDTSKQIKGTTGIVLVPEGRELSANKYNNQKEGTMFEANADGTLAQYSGVSSTRYNYRTFAQDGLDAFALTLVSSTAYAHLRYSTDDGESWTNLNQGGGNTRQIIFPEKQGETNPVVKVTIQILDDKAYNANMQAGQDGFAGASPAVYTLWAEQLPASGMKMLSASASHGNWYPVFKDDHYSYNIMVASGEAAPVLTYTVSDGAEVKVGSAIQTPVEGNYTLTLTNSYQSVIITGEKGSATYQFRYSVRADERYPNKVVDYLPINSQYTNNGQYGMVPERVITGGDVLSLGNFGGYATFYYEEPLINDPNNKYGVDFYIYGNSQTDTSTGTPFGFMEPGQVWVSEDNETWYALAGSEHYEDSTLWDYEITYKKTSSGATSWTDNQDNQDNGKQVGQWPSAANYPLNALLPTDSITMRGILLPCVDGSITGNGQFSAMSKGAKFGYVDVLNNSTKGEDANPYLYNDDYQLPSSGFDLAWAVDSKGQSVDVSDKEFHYVKVVTASNLWAGSANEKSTEIGGIVRTLPQLQAVGLTDLPAGITITDGKTSKSISFTADKDTYELHLGSMSYVSVNVDGAKEGDNIYVNNQRVDSDHPAQGILVTKEGKLLRIIAQNGDKEPVILLIKLTSDAEPSLISGIKVESYGSDRLADTTDGKNYKITVGYRIDVTKITPVVAAGTSITINGSSVKDSYELDEGENTFTITAVKGEEEQTVTLTVTRENAPTPSGSITVYFTLLGDALHGDAADDSDIHTLKSGNLKTWIAQKAYKVDSPATVLDVLEMALEEAGMSHVNAGGNYISEINGLAEFDNGWLSGWMYTLNGKHPGLGVMEQSVANGDRIVFHYTDDFTVEEGSDGYDNSGLAAGAASALQDRTAAKEVKTLIEAIGTVTERSGDAIKKARAAYDALTSAQKKLVPNYSDLTAAEKKYAELTGQKAENPFTDVTEDAFYFEAVQWAVEQGITNGTGETTFSPNASCTRAQMVTFLWRAAGSPKAKDTSSTFADVDPNAYYYEALLWAVEQGITNGTSETSFSPDAVCNRAQMATFLYRSAKSPAVEGDHAFGDVKDNAYYENAVIWAAQEGITNGTAANAFSPNADCTRGQMVTFLYRYLAE